MADARRAFDRAVELDPTSASARFDLGSAAFESGDDVAAEAAYMAAVPLDARLAPLALLRAGTAAEKGGRHEAALAHFGASAEAARAAGQAHIVEEADAEHVAAARAQAQMRTRKLAEDVRAAKTALETGHFDEAADRYGAALADAEYAGRPASDRAELEFALGLAIWRAGDACEAVEPLEAAHRHAPREGDFAFLLGVATYDCTDFDDNRARAVLEQALGLGLPAENAQVAKQRLARLALGDETPFDLDVHASFGYDSNVPQSSAFTTAATPLTEQDLGAPFLSTDAALVLRRGLNRQTRIGAEYRFSQLAYLTSTADSYSLQEHDLGGAVRFVPRPWLSVEGGATGFLMLSGVRGYGPFQTGARLGVRATGTRGPWELELAGEHTFKRSLDSDYDALSGMRDDALVYGRWHGGHTLLALGYRLRVESIGTDRIPVSDLSFPAASSSLPATDVYIIPGSYVAHEVSFGERTWLVDRVRLGLQLRYERRNYEDASYILETSGATTYPRSRIDDRITIDATVLVPISRRLDVEVGYTLIVNRSNIDNSAAATGFDYDNKNYLKQVGEAGIAYHY
jgi:tetratricopeptide (TPR) repeat protein